MVDSMKITYLITVCVEAQELLTLLYSLRFVIDKNDEIIVVIDEGNTNTDVINVINNVGVTHYLHKFVNFSEQWEFASSKCSGDYIFGLCADEIPSPHLINSLKPKIQQLSPDCILVPRINLYVDAFPAKVNNMYVGNRPPQFILNEPQTDLHWHCWPDYQLRISKNDGRKKLNNTHGSLSKCKSHYSFPPEEQYALLHIKTIKHQERMLKLYDSINNR